MKKNSLGINWYTQDLELAVTTGNSFWTEKMFLGTYSIIALPYKFRRPTSPDFSYLLNLVSLRTVECLSTTHSGRVIRRNSLLFSAIKFLCSVFLLRQVATSLGDLSIYYPCQFWELATLNQARDICYGTNLASQCGRLRREYNSFEQITQVDNIPPPRSIAY